MSQKKFDIASAISRTLGESLFAFSSAGQAMVHDKELWVFVEQPNISNPEAMKAATEVLAVEIPDSVSAAYYVLPHWIAGEKEEEKAIIGFGRVAVTTRFAVRKLVDLPSTFDSSQQKLIDEALSPLEHLGTAPISMDLFDCDGKRFNAADTLSKLIQAPIRTQAGLVFIEAEAGKGKTILLASQARQMRRDGHGKLPIYIPLRKLPLETGLVLEHLTRLIGVVDKGAERLTAAVRHGLVTLFLDGIDEVSGRYDKNLIRNLLQLIADHFGGQESVVILSGRKTETRYLNPLEWAIYNVELPDLDTADFRNYVGSVLDGLIQQSNFQGKIPEEYKELMGDRPADEQVRRERDKIIQWILDVFPEVALQPSLFFVQGLAAIAIGRRSGNRATIRDQQGLPFVPRIWDVCLIAAVFACLREVSKIDSVAANEYTVQNQMRVLQGLAVIASAPSLGSLPAPNELVEPAFDISSIHSAEVYIAIVRQNAKHALLYAVEAAGGYRPQFLNDWIRCSLLAQIFNSNPPVGELRRPEILKLAVSAKRANYTYGLLLPSGLDDGQVPKEWLDAFDVAIDYNIEEASANQWILRAAVGDDRLAGSTRGPLPLAEITKVEFVGFAIGQELSGNDFMLDGTVFVNSTINNVKLSAVSLRNVAFADCEISDSSLAHCEGPVIFEDCTFTNIAIHNITSAYQPALQFKNCVFNGDNNRIEQTSAAYGESQFSPIASFKECFTDGDVNTVVQGHWAAMEVPFSGVRKRESRMVSRSEACLRRALRTFFPSQIGSRVAVQARPYIRLSALGRGSMPAGSPGQEQLQGIFEGAGFTTGGRADHLYGPWSSVAGASTSGMLLRNELVDFLLDSTKKGTNVVLMLDKIKQYFPTE